VPSASDIGDANPVRLLILSLLMIVLSNPSEKMISVPVSGFSVIRTCSLVLLKLLELLVQVLIQLLGKVAYNFRGLCPGLMLGVLNLHIGHLHVLYVFRKD
jgi:hypothetical protein